MMRLASKLALIAIGVLVSVWLVFSWFEAEQEIRILCSHFHPGMDHECVVETLRTGEYLRYRTEAGGNHQTIVVDSLYNLRTSRCVIEFEDGRVRSSAYE